MERCRILLEPGRLRPLAEQATLRAMDSGALLPVRTSTTFLEDGPVRFVIRIVSSLDRKHRALKALDIVACQERSEHNPFLPYDNEMFVGDITDSHVCLLNKYNVIDNHLLLVTKEFEHQEELLTVADFCAALACLAEFDSLVFYNGGLEGGASQPHKHLQMIPLPLIPGETSLPVEQVISGIRLSESPVSSPALPFRHALCRLESRWWHSPVAGCIEARRRYGRLLEANGLADDGSPGGRQSGPYNLLMTRRWMLLLPRSKGSYRSISVNSLGFAGSLLARDENDLATLREAGPLRVLREVTGTAT